MTNTHYLTCSHQALPTLHSGETALPVTLASVPAWQAPSPGRPAKIPAHTESPNLGICRASVLAAAVTDLISQKDRSIPS